MRVGFSIFDLPFDKLRISDDFRVFWPWGGTESCIRSDENVVPKEPRVGLRLSILGFQGLILHPFMHVALLNSQLFLADRPLLIKPVKGYCLPFLT